MEMLAQANLNKALPGIVAWMPIDEPCKDPSVTVDGHICYYDPSGLIRIKKNCICIIHSRNGKQLHVLPCTTFGSRGQITAAERASRYIPVEFLFNSERFDLEEGQTCIRIEMRDGLSIQSYEKASWAEVMVGSDVHVIEIQGDLDIVGEVVYDDLDTLKKNIVDNHAEIEARKQYRLHKFETDAKDQALTYEKIKMRSRPKPGDLGKEPWEVKRVRGQIQQHVAAGLKPEDNPTGERKPQSSSSANTGSPKSASSPIESTPDSTARSSDVLPSEQMSNRDDEDSDPGSSPRTTPSFKVPIVSPGLGHPAIRGFASTREGGR